MNETSIDTWKEQQISELIILIAVNKSIKKRDKIQQPIFTAKNLLPTE